MLLLLLLGPGSLSGEGSHVEAGVRAGTEEPAPTSIDGGPPRCQAANGLDSALAYLALYATRVGATAYGDGCAFLGQMIVS